MKLRKNSQGWNMDLTDLELRFVKTSLDLACEVHDPEVDDLDFDPWLCGDDASQLLSFGLDLGVQYSRWRDVDVPRTEGDSYERGRSGV